MSQDNYEYFKEEDSFQEYHADLNWPKPAHALSRSTGSPPIILHLECGTVEIRNNTIVEMGRRGNKADMLRFQMIERDANARARQIMCRTGEKAHIVISENAEDRHKAKQSPSTKENQ